MAKKRTVQDKLKYHKAVADNQAAANQNVDMINKSRKSAKEKAELLKQVESNLTAANEQAKKDILGEE